MDNFFLFLENHSNGILLSLLVLIVLMGIVQWGLWLFNKGRFAKANHRRTIGDSVGLIFSEVVIKMVNDLGHVIALIIISIFSFTLVFGIIQTGGNPTAMRETLQAIISTMGGLVGAVIGYYFNSANKNNGLSQPGEPLPTLEIPPLAIPPKSDQ